MMRLIVASVLRVTLAHLNSRGQKATLSMSAESVFQPMEELLRVICVSPSVQSGGGITYGCMCIYFRRRVTRRQAKSDSSEDHQ